MKAILDHVGIAVKDLDAALAFYRDALGLDIEAPEEVLSQHVRAHFVPVGESTLELLEPTDPASAIARYLDKRGPGLHHITLRVDDIQQALDQLKTRGVRMIDERPRPGAEGALVAFVHPSAAHGVLVELKQAAVHPPGAPGTRGGDLSISRYRVGELEIISLFDGFFRLDGGQMFGTVPKALWQQKAPSDALNRITLAMRPLIVRGRRTMIIDAGLGDTVDEKFRARFGVDRTRNLDHALAEAGVSVQDIDIVLATHLHFDHAGGFTVQDASGRLRPRFPRAQYIVRRGEWDDARHPNVRTKASYRPENFVPLADAGVLQLVDEDSTIMPGVKVVRTGGHTRHHQMVVIESGGKTAVFVADLIPTTAHLEDAWIMGFDLFPLETLEAKQRLLKEVAANDALIFFEHDPAVAAGYIRVDDDGKRRVVTAGEGS